MEILVHTADGTLKSKDIYAVGTKHWWHIKSYGKKYPCRVVPYKDSDIPPTHRRDYVRIIFEPGCGMGLDTTLQSKKSLTPID